MLRSLDCETLTQHMCMLLRSLWKVHSGEYACGSAEGSASGSLPSLAFQILKQL